MFSITLSGVSLVHGEHENAAILPHHEHAHQEEVPDTNPVGRASIEVISSGTQMATTRIDFRGFELLGSTGILTLK